MINEEHIIISLISYYFFEIFSEKSFLLKLVIKHTMCISTTSQSIYVWHNIKCCSFVPPKKTGGTEAYFCCPNLKKNRSIPSGPLGRKVVIMTKARAQQKNRDKRTANYKSQIIKIRDWLGFFFTVVGFFLSVSGKVQINIQGQCNVTIEVYNSFFEKEEAKWNLEDFLLNLENDTSNTEKDNTDKQKYSIEWACINLTEHPQVTLKRKKRSVTHENEH